MYEYKSIATLSECPYLLFQEILILCLICIILGKIITFFFIIRTSTLMTQSFFLVRHNYCLSIYRIKCRTYYRKYKLNYPFSRWQKSIKLRLVKFSPIYVLWWMKIFRLVTLNLYLPKICLISDFRKFWTRVNDIYFNFPQTNRM